MTLPTELVGSRPVFMLTGEYDYSASPADSQATAARIAGEGFPVMPHFPARRIADKATLAEFGFRLPSCIDNRPLRFEEWDLMRPQSMYVSATPGSWELERTGGVFVEQVIRPTGLVDPPIELRPVATQVDDLMAECTSDFSKILELQEIKTLYDELQERHTSEINEREMEIARLRGELASQEPTAAEEAEALWDKDLS